jgi:hypothetical protein
MARDKGEEAEVRDQLLHPGPVTKKTYQRIDEHQIVRVVRRNAPRNLTFDEAIAVARRMLTDYGAQKSCYSLMQIRNYPESADSDRKQLHSVLVALGWGEKTPSETDLRDLEHYLFAFFIAQLRGAVAPQAGDRPLAAQAKMRTRYLAAYALTEITPVYSNMKKVWQEWNLPDVPLLPSLNGAKTSAPDPIEVKFGILGAFDGFADGTTAARVNAKQIPGPGMRAATREFFGNVEADMIHSYNEWLGNRKKPIEELEREGYLKAMP